MHRSKSPASISRRAAIRTLLGAGTALTLGPVGPVWASGDAMRRRTIPASDEPLPIVGLGTWQQFDVGESEERRRSLAKVLRALYEHGGRVVDSSPMYGRSEQVVGSLAATLGISEELFMASKVWTEGRRAGIEQMQRSMERMSSEPMDLMQVHNLKDWRAHLETLQAWKEAGRVRYVGVTHYRTDAFDALEHVIRHADVDFVQLPFSIRTRSTEERLLPLAADRGVAVIVNRPFEGGDLFEAVKGHELPNWARPMCASWAQFFLKFIVARPEVTCVIPGTSDPEHARDNMGAGSGPLPDRDMRKRMVAHFAKLA